MKIDIKIRKEAEKLVDKFIKRYAEKDSTGKLTGHNDILVVSPANLRTFLQSDEYFAVSKISIPTTIKRDALKRQFRKKLNAHAKHYFKDKMDFKAYNEEFEEDPSIMTDRWKEYIKIIKQEE